MTTAAQVVKAILQELVVQASEADLEPAEIQDTIFGMNNYMTALDANGTSLGYTVVDSLSDVITIPAGAIQGLISNVAIMMAPQFDAIVTPALMEKARMGLSAMRKLSFTRVATQPPCTLPVGSGNEWGGGYDTDRFYPCADDAILTETNRNILLEDNS